jgi:hypothetical protein
MPTESGSATLVAVTKNVPRFPFEVKRPVWVMLPPPLTAQVTSWMSVSSTTAVNCRLAPGAMVVCDGVTTMPPTELRQGMTPPAREAKRLLKSSGWTTLQTL